MTSEPKPRCAHCKRIPVGFQQMGCFEAFKPYCSAFCRELADLGVPSPHRVKRLPKTEREDAHGKL